MNTFQVSDQLSIDTPEQVTLALPVAGLGSRILAHLVDIAIQIGTYLLLILIVSFTVWNKIDSTMEKASDTQTKWVLAGFILLNFTFVWGYYTLFEAFWDGQTPGKRFIKIRVMKDSGRQATLFESMARNFMRSIDMLPTAYIAGIISILATRENKRLGDLVAGTIVVRAEDRHTDSISTSNRTITIGTLPEFTPVKVVDFGIEFPPEAIARLNSNDLMVMESYFARIPELDFPTTERIAQQILIAMCRKMEVPVPESPSARKCVDSIAYSLRGVAAYR